MKPFVPADPGSIILVLRRVKSVFNKEGTVATELSAKPGSDELERLIDKMIDAETASYMLGIMDNLEALYVLTVSLNEFLKRGDEIISSLSDSLNELKSGVGDQGVGYVDALKELFSCAKALGDRSQQLGSVLREQILTENFVAGISVLTKSLAQAQKTASESRSARVKGVGSLLRSLKDPDVQKGLDFALELVRAIGRNSVEGS
jgi:uncharacterized protein YjgD (DUF1641 family)